MIGLIIKKRRFDISATYDGVVVVSNTFRLTVKSNKLTGLVFTTLPDDPEFLRIEAMSTISFDAEKRKTRFFNQCSVCGRFESVVGATPVFLAPPNVIPDRGFVQTDLEFGSDDEKHPMILCGLTAGEILESVNLSGLELLSF